MADRAADASAASRQKEFSLPMVILAAGLAKHSPSSGEVLPPPPPVSGKTNKYAEFSGAGNRTAASGVAWSG